MIWYGAWLFAGVTILILPGYLAFFQMGWAASVAAPICYALGGLVFLMAVGMTWAGWPYLWIYQHLTLGEDRLQYLVDDQVIGEVPYSNIADARLSEELGCVGLRLKDVGRADTRWPMLGEFKVEPGNFDFLLGPSMQATPEAIMAELQKRLQAFQRSAAQRGEGD